LTGPPTGRPIKRQKEREQEKDNTQGRNKAKLRKTEKQTGDKGGGVILVPISIHSYIYKMYTYMYIVIDK